MNTDLIITVSELLCKGCGQQLEARTRPAHEQTALSGPNAGKTRVVPEVTVLICINEECLCEGRSFDVRTYDETTVESLTKL